MSCGTTLIIWHHAIYYGHTFMNHIWSMPTHATCLTTCGFVDMATVCMLHSNSKALEIWHLHSIYIHTIWFQGLSKGYLLWLKYGLSFWFETTFVVSWSNNALTMWFPYRYGGIGKMGQAVPSPYGCLGPQMGIQRLDVSCVLTTKNLIWTVCGVLIPIWLGRPLLKRPQYGKHLVKPHGIVICILWKVRQEPSLPSEGRKTRKLQSLAEWPYKNLTAVIRKRGRHAFSLWIVCGGMCFWWRWCSLECV